MVYGWQKAVRAGLGDLAPYVAVSVTQDFVQDVAELPAENGATGQREAQSVGPEGVGSLLPVSPQDDSCCRLVKEETTNNTAYHNFICFLPVVFHCSALFHHGRHRPNRK